MILTDHPVLNRRFPNSPPGHVIMRLQVLPTSVQGRVAVTNLIAVLITLLTYTLLFPDLTRYVDQEPAWKNLVADALSWVIICLTFPIGWLSMYFMPLHGHTPLTIFWTVLLIPLNANFWGAVVEWYLEFVDEPAANDRADIGGSKTNVNAEKNATATANDAASRSER